MSKRNIPSEEEFERASAAMRVRDLGLGEVCARIMERFNAQSLREAFIFYSEDKNTFFVSLFFCLSKQIKEAEESGLCERIKDALVEELVNVGRGTRDSIKIDVEWDSDENVQANFEGDYFLRLR